MTNLYLVYTLFVPVHVLGLLETSTLNYWYILYITIPSLSNTWSKPTCQDHVIQMVIHGGKYYTNADLDLYSLLLTHPS